MKECDQTDPHFGVQAVRGKFVRSPPPPPSLPAGFAFSIENSRGAIWDRGSGGLLRAQWMCAYDPVVRSFQCRSDLNLLCWVQPVPVYDDWTVIECPPSDLRSSSHIGEEGSGRETRLANVGFCSEKFGGFAKNLPCERSILRVLIKTFLQE